MQTKIICSGQWKVRKNGIIRRNADNNVVKRVAYVWFLERDLWQGDMTSAIKAHQARKIELFYLLNLLS